MKQVFYFTAFIMLEYKIGKGLNIENFNISLLLTRSEKKVAIYSILLKYTRHVCIQTSVGDHDDDGHLGRFEGIWSSGARYPEKEPVFEKGTEGITALCYPFYRKRLWSTSSSTGPPPSR